MPNDDKDLGPLPLADFEKQELAAIEAQIRICFENATHLMDRTDPNSVHLFDYYSSLIKVHSQRRVAIIDTAKNRAGL